MGVFRAPPVTNFVVDPVGRLGNYVMWRLADLRESAQRKVRQRTRQRKVLR